MANYVESYKKVNSNIRRKNEEVTVDPGDSITDEVLQDKIGAMVDGGTQTGIAVTYQDSTADVDFEVDDQYVNALVEDYIVDEDNMVSNSATLVPSQQSVKAYVDTTTADMITDANDITDLTALGETNIAEIAVDANGTAIATAVNGILDILIAAGLMDAPA